MSAYIPYKINLNNSQKQNLARAVKTKEPIKLRLSLIQLQNGSDMLGLTKTQINRIEKHKADEKGIDIALSPRQVSKQGGFLGSLLLNIAKTAGVSALESLTSGLVNKIISGTGCDYNEFTVQMLPHLLENCTNDQKEAINKKGGFIVPLLATLASTLVPTIVNLMTGRGYQVRPPAGTGYQVQPPKNYLSTL